MKGPSSSSTKTTVDRHQSDRTEHDSDVEIDPNQNNVDDNFDLNYDQEQHKRMATSNEYLDLQQVTTEELERDNCSDDDLVVETPRYEGGSSNRVEKTTAVSDREKQLLHDVVENDDANSFTEHETSKVKASLDGRDNSGVSACHPKSYFNDELTDSKRQAKVNNKVSPNARVTKNSKTLSDREIIALHDTAENYFSTKLKSTTEKETSKGKADEILKSASLQDLEHSQRGPSHSEPDAKPKRVPLQDLEPDAKPKRVPLQDLDQDQHGPLAHLTRAAFASLTDPEESLCDDRLTEAKVRAHSNVPPAAFLTRNASATSDRDAVQMQVKYMTRRKNKKVSFESENNTSAGNTSSDNTNVSQDDNRDTGSSQDLDQNEQPSRPGAFAVAGIDGESDEWVSTDFSQNTDHPDDICSFVEEVEEATSAGGALHATVVDEEELERDLLERLTMRQSISIAISETMEMQESAGKRRVTLFLSVFITALIGISIILGLWFGIWEARSNVADNTDMPTPTIQPTIEYVPTTQKILERGYLNCGKRGSGSFAYFNMDMCRAIAAAIFGNNSSHLIKFIDLSGISAPSTLDLLAANVTFDLIARGLTFTMQRDVFQESNRVGFTFSTPILYDGLKIAGDPLLVQCVDDLNFYEGECKNLKICMCKDCTHNTILRQQFPSNKLISVPKVTDVYKGFADGKCNLIAHERPYIAKSIFEKEVPNYKGEYKVGTHLFSKEPIALVTRDDDYEWSNFCDWVLQALLASEKYNITQETADAFPLTPTPFDDEFDNMFVNAIKAVGNYGEIYDRHLQDLVPREGLDWINTDGKTGLMYSFPFGDLTSVGPDPLENGMLDSIINRGYLLCGIRRYEPGFGNLDSSTQVWHGMDADYCRALSAGIFDGDIDAVEFVEVQDGEDGFVLLSSGRLDVLTGGGLTFETSVVGVSGEGFSFSQPYFYPEDSSPHIAFATRQSDRQWSSFVYWVVSCVVHAEEKGIRNDTSFYMPEVFLFGSKFAFLFKNVVEAVGNYEQMYTRNLEEYHTREGTRNMLNEIPLCPQHFPLL